MCRINEGIYAYCSYMWSDRVSNLKFEKKKGYEINTIKRKNCERGQHIKTQCPMLLS